MGDGSDKKKDPLLEDTHEMERIRAPGFREHRERQPSGIVDPWNDVTPQDLSGEQPALDVTASYVDDDEEDDPGDFLGDGPYASPVDTPQEERVMRIADPRSPSAISRFALAASALSQPVIVPPRGGRAASGIRIGDAPVAVARRLPSGIGNRAAELARAQLQSQEPPRDRRYPKMRALLRNPEQVPHGSAPAAKPRPPPVPGTFIPASKREKERTMTPAATADLDEMLATMAEGLLIGEDAAGHTEVRVTLRDEFFSGTELRIKLGEEGVIATLVPPDRSTYLTLNGNIDELRLRLESRGLRVTQIRVAEP